MKQTKHTTKYMKAKELVRQLNNSTANTQKIMDKILQMLHKELSK
jgi:hypothetical protein